ncbi:hypothetical protein OKW96_04380 [Sphingobacterium sp. KU25419]|nr:hypothetical protein OKW96_04380 [Sphingobacterium sp. KU25419]
MKLLTIIVLYQPNIEILLKGIRSLIDQSDEVLLYENSKLSDSEIVAIYSNCGESGAEKIKFVGNGINRGISGALNFAVDWGVQYSFTHLLTMDQDSHFDLGGVENFKKIITSLVRQDIGVYSPNPVINGKATYERNDKGIYFEVDTITSGSIFSIPLLKHFDGFDDSLFIDAVDYEFCIGYSL